MADGNTTTTPDTKKDSLLDKTIKQWTAEHGGDTKTAHKWRPDPKSSQNFKDKIVKARKAVKDAEAAVEAAKKAQDAAEAEGIAFFGPHRIQLSTGELLDPTCRGDRLFYKEADASTPL